MPRFSRLVKWVRRNYWRLTFSLVQRVRDANLLQLIGGWHSHLAQLVCDFNLLQFIGDYDWPGVGRTWSQFLMVHRKLTLALWLACLRVEVSISYSSSVVDILAVIGLAQLVRDFNLLRLLTFSLRLTWLREYVISICYGLSVADILTMIRLAQIARNFPFLQFIGGWYSHYNWPGLGCTWFQSLTVHRRLTFSLRLAWLRECVISIRNSSLADIFTTIYLAQYVRDLISYSSTAAEIQCSDCKQYSNSLLKTELLTTAVWKIVSHYCFLLHTMTSVRFLVALPSSRRYEKFHDWSVWDFPSFACSRC